MKKIILSIAIASLFAACSNSSSEEKKDGDKKETGATGTGTGDDLSSNPVYQKGIALIGKSDCLTCHKIDEPLTGPSYRDVANKYAGSPDTIVSYLADKIIVGGKGNWGETFMTPHAGLSKEDAEAMVKYILLLKK
jgi:cytochrome c